MSAGRFWSGILFGLAASIAGATFFRALAPVFGSGFALRGMLVLLALATAAWTLHRSDARVGRVVAGVAWLSLCAGLALFDFRLWFWLTVLSTALWLTRSLFGYRSLVNACIDGLISLFAVGAGVAALDHSHSLVLALWSYFLVIALTALIPQGADAVPPAPEEDVYERARRTADAALRRLSHPR